MSHRDGFLQEIREAPDDEAHRLIFADWLEEQDDPRGELMRLQCELARWVPDLERRDELYSRCNHLIERHRDEWLGELSKDQVDCRFERGLPRLTLPARRFVQKRFGKLVPALLAEAMVHTLKLSDVGKYLEQLVEAPQLEAVGSLDLDGSSLDDDAVAMLAASPHTANLIHLDLANNLIGNEGARALAGSSQLNSLRSLDLRNNSVTTTGARALLRRAERDGWRLLDLHGNALGAAEEDWLVWRRERIPRHPANGLPALLINSIGLEMVLVPAGVFLMGSPGDETHRHQNEGPQHAVEITRPFYISRYQVTQGEYRRIMETNPSTFSPTGYNAQVVSGLVTDALPVEMVNYFDGLEFCEKLSARPEETAAGRRYRLLTEAEWEYACRGGLPSFIPYGLGPTVTFSQVNFGSIYDASHGSPLGRTALVGSFEPNQLGIYDMHGNVWEWCLDWFNERYYARSPRRDPRGPKRGTNRILRGGCHVFGSDIGRAAYRGYRLPPTERLSYFGLRILCEIDAG
jgi:uncharacterized protein (TIGR02996 family)